MTNFDIFDDPPVRQPPRSTAAEWPSRVVIAMSLFAIVLVTVLRSFVPAVTTYLVLLFVGCGLLYFSRRQAIGETRRAGGVGFVQLTVWDRAALAALVLACFANGIVIALEVATWDWAS